MAQCLQDVEIQDRYYGKELIRIVQVEKNGENKRIKALEAVIIKSEEKSNE